MSTSPDPEPPVASPPPASPTTAASAAGSLPRCACGHDRHHAMARPEPKYGLGGWLRLFMGVSAKPQRMIYRCRRCNAVIEESSAAEALDKSY